MAMASAGPYANNLYLPSHITTSTPHHSIFFRLNALSDAQPTVPINSMKATITVDNFRQIVTAMVAAVRIVAAAHWLFMRNQISLYLLMGSGTAHVPAKLPLSVGVCIPI